MFLRRAVERLVTTLGGLIYRVRGPLLARYTEVAIAREGELPRPKTPPHVHATGATPDRLLLLGGASVEGLGVTTHDLALGGQLARRISRLTGRGIDLDILSRRDMAVGDAIRVLASTDLTGYDGVVLMLGKHETSGLQPRRVWAREVTALFDWLDVNAPAGMHTFIVQIPNFPDFIELPRWLGRLITRHAARLNAVTDALARGRSSVSLVRFDPGAVEHPPRFSTPATYQWWAQVMAPDIASVLERTSAVPHRPMPADERDRQRALDDLHILDTPADERFDRLARMARDALGVEGAQINFVDRDRTWTKAAASVSAEGSDRLHSFCATTVTRRELFVVENAAERPEFADFPSVSGEQHIRFYAGYPIEAPNGQLVGALCVIDSRPRTLSVADGVILRELALRVQQVLWTAAEEGGVAL